MFNIEEVHCTAAIRAVLAANLQLMHATVEEVRARGGLHQDTSSSRCAAARPVRLPRIPTDAPPLPR